MAVALGWVAMVAAAAASLGCVLALRPRRPSTLFAAVVMLVAMIDMAVGHLLLPPVGWAAALTFVGVFVVAGPRSVDLRCSWQHGLALVAAAVIMISSPHTLSVAHAVGLGHSGHPAAAGPLGGGWPLGLLIAAGYAVVAGASVLRPAAAPPAQPTGVPRLQVVQVAASTSCLALMAMLSSTA